MTHTSASLAGCASSSIPSAPPGGLRAIDRGSDPGSRKNRWVPVRSARLEFSTTRPHVVRIDQSFDMPADGPRRVHRMVECADTGPGIGTSPKRKPRRDKFPGMRRERSSFKESQSWFNPSEVFADTQRVDLFNDPRWETTSHSSPKRSADGKSRRPSRWTTPKANTFRRLLMKRGKHSRNLV